MWTSHYAFLLLLSETKNGWNRKQTSTDQQAFFIKQWSGTFSGKKLGVNYRRGLILTVFNESFIAEHLVWFNHWRLNHSRMCRLGSQEHSCASSKPRSGGAVVKVQSPVAGKWWKFRAHCLSSPPRTHCPPFSLGVVISYPHSGLSVSKPSYTLSIQGVQ